MNKNKKVMEIFIFFVFTWMSKKETIYRNK